MKNKLSELQDRFSQIDLMTRPSRNGLMEILLKEYQSIKLIIDGNKNHARAHIHLSYGINYHAASYAIDDGERLVGTRKLEKELKRKYDNCVKIWINENREILQSVWDKVRNGKSSTIEVELLKKSEFE